MKRSYAVGQNEYSGELSANDVVSGQYYIVLTLSGSKTAIDKNETMRNFSCGIDIPKETANEIEWIKVPQSYFTGLETVKINKLSQAQEITQDVPAWKMQKFLDGGGKAGFYY